MSSNYTFVSLGKKMTHDNLVIGKGSVVMLLCHTIKPSEHISKKYLKIDRGKRLENAVVFYT